MTNPIVSLPFPFFTHDSLSAVSSEGAYNFAGDLAGKFTAALSALQEDNHLVQVTTTGIDSLSEAGDHSIVHPVFSSDTADIYYLSGRSDDVASYVTDLHAVGVGQGASVEFIMVPHGSDSGMIMSFDIAATVVPVDGATA